MKIMKAFTATVDSFQRPLFESSTLSNTTKTLLLQALRFAEDYASTRDDPLASLDQHDRNTAMYNMAVAGIIEQLERETKK